MKYLKKISILVSWIILRIGILASESPIFLVTERQCITNSSSAIAFNAPIDEAKNIPSYFYPELSNDYKDINCKIEEDENCTKELWTSGSWTLEDSIDGHVKNLITDWRWEELPMYRTMNIDIYSKNLKYRHILELQGENFDIPISVRSEKEAHIYLCHDDTNPHDSNCYWFMLQAFNGKKSALRKCSSGFIDKAYGDWPGEPCSTSLKENMSVILNQTLWNHFRVIRKDNTLSLVKNNQVLLEYTDDDPFQVKNMFIHSKRVNALWKVHKYSYIYCTTKETKQKGSELQIVEGENCISMFIIMCSMCEMLVLIIDLTDVELYNHTFKTEDENWKEIKILLNSPARKASSLYISTVSSENNGIFWAIDNVRRCSEKEYRILNLKDLNGVPCQIIENENALDINQLKNKEIQELGNPILDTSCPEDTIGKYCIPCQIFGSKLCSGFKYCELLGKATECFCTAGYLSENCNKKCGRDQYGHGCKQHCGNCDGDCHYIDGACKSEQCINNFKGKKCNIPPVPLLKNPPKIVNIGPTSCTVQISNFGIDISDDTYGTPKYFKFQYKKTDNNTIGWVDANTNKVYNFGDSDEIVIDNLKADTEYYVRAVLYSNRNDIYLGDVIKKEKFRTPCVGIASNDISFKPKNTSVTISFKLYIDSCQIDNYLYSIHSKDQNTNNTKQAAQTLEIKGLKPNRKYVLTLAHVFSEENLTESFTTTEGVPSQVQELNSVDTSTNTISLKWKKPQDENGIITHYLVKYRLIKGNECADPINPPHNYVTNREEKTTVTLNDLHPYAEYEIAVCAVTSEGPGEDEFIMEQTQTSENIEIDENLRILGNITDATSVTLQLNTLDCNKMNGPIFLSVVAKCEEKWCHASTTYSGKYNINFPVVTLQKLFSDVNYKLIMKISRSQTDWSVTENGNFRTQPSVPNTITDITVTSKDETSISLRWKPPYPPTGTLKKYYIAYYTSSFRRWTYSKETDPAYCKLWHNFHCATISEGITENWVYQIQISATNESPLKYVTVSKYELSVKARTEVPETPYDVVGDWKRNNNLHISWNHPNVTNGPIKKFTIKLSNGKYFTKYIYSEDDYNLTYTHKITQHNMEPCSEYTVTIIAHNKYFESRAILPAQFRDWSPPPIPPIMSEQELITSSTNHTITIEIPRLEYKGPNKINCQKKLYLLIADNVNSEETYKDVTHFRYFLQKKQNDLILNFYTILLEIDQEDLPIGFNIGNDSVTQTRYGNFSNPPLKLGKAHNIILFFANDCKGKVRFKGVNKTVYTTGDPKVYVPDEQDSKNNLSGLYALILLILLIPLLLYVYTYLKREKTAPEILTIFKQPQSSRVIKQTRKTKNDDEIPLSIQEPPKGSMPSPMVKPRMSISGNIPPVIRTEHSKRVRINDFELYVKESLANEELLRQHRLFPRGQTQPWECGALKENKSKNRYNNLIAYDHTRVKLSRIPGVAHSDYINANYIDGYRVAKAYIATQGPKASTLNDFWRMVWKENVKHIIMLANLIEGGKKKVEKYWPDINEEKDFEGIRVQYISSEVFANYEFRVFNVYNKNAQRRVEQLHFTSWPDHGVPLYSQSLVPFLQRILKIPNSTNSPVLIHCSAGVGRTGTIILCDICLRMAAGEGSVDFLAYLENIRSQRANLVDNDEQYKLAHLVVLECLFGMPTSIACNDDMDNAIQNILSGGGVKTQLRYLIDTEWQDKAMDTVWDIDDVPPIPPEKNRFQDIIPEIQHQIFLLRYPPEDEHSSYINAVQVDGFRSPDRFIVTQQPLPNTLGDFWRLVMERRSTVIISLNEINKNDQTSCQFWPEKNTKIKPVDYLQIGHVSSTILDCYRTITVRVTNLRENESTLVNIISMNNWMPNDLLPNSVEEYLSFWEESDALARQSPSVVVTCYNGATASGLYIATSFIMEKMKLEQECDVCLAVRTIRHNRKQFVTSEEQFEFLYRASLMYIKGFQSYANFT